VDKVATPDDVRLVPGGEDFLELPQAFFHFVLWSSNGKVGGTQKKQNMSADLGKFCPRNLSRTSKGHNKSSLDLLGQQFLVWQLSFVSMLAPPSAFSRRFTLITMRQDLLLVDPVGASDLKHGSATHPASHQQSSDVRRK